MLQFILGVIVGGVVGFVVCAILASANLNKPTQKSFNKKAGDDRAPLE